MAFVLFSHISLSFGDRDILKEVTLNLAEGTKAALTGANGSGKSTLMKVLSGDIQSDSGDRAIQKGCRIAYLPQAGIVHTGCSLLEEVDKAFIRGKNLSLKLEELGEELAKNPESKSLLESYHEIQTEFENSGYDRRKSLIEQTVTGLGFEISDLNRSVAEFSGGWQMRIALAKVLLSNPDILLLDEPTNYLDIEARNWLEQWLKEFSGGFLLVSHDRYFLDVTVNEVYELFGGALHRYPGNYTHYEKVREVELASLIARYQIQQEEIHKLEDFIRRFRYKATKAAQAQEKIKILDKMERIEIPESLKKIHFTFPPAPHSGKLVLTIENLCKSYPSEDKDNPVRKVLNDLSLVLEKGERLVVAGRNGAGKSTLLRILAGEDKYDSGVIKLGSGVSIGYFSQDHAECLSGDESIIELFEKEAPLELIPKIRDMLGAFLFRGDDVYKTISVLSGGEKSRLALLRLLLKPINLLILDEPTNHLDLGSKDVLLDALKNFDGTILFVSHDRGFIEGLATRVLELTPGHFRLFPGNYKYYMERLEDEKNGVVQFLSSEPKKDVPVEKEVSSNQLSWEEDKKRKAERRKLEKEEESLLAEIEKAEEEKSLLEEQLADPAVYSDAKKSTETQKAIFELEKKIELLNERWEEVALKLEA